MRVHVTGDRGFVARHLLAELEARGHDVSGSDVADAFAPERILEDELLGSEAPGPDVIVHAGAVVGRELRGLGSERAVQLNVVSTELLANAAAAAGVPFVYLSSSEVYGPRDGLIAFEDDPLVELPHNLYGLTKRWGEDVCRLAYRARPDLLTIARLSMPYGPGHLPGSGRAALTNFLWAAMQGRPLVVHRGAVRSWCWIGDTARALAILAENAAARNAPPYAYPVREPFVYNVGRNDNERTMLEVAELVLEVVADSTSAIALTEPPEGFSLVKRLDVSRMTELGWTPVVELEDGIWHTLVWLRETAPLVQA